jgi:hypothetical protein
MILEKDLAKLSYSQAPKMVTYSVPGAKGEKTLEDSNELSPQQAVGNYQVN